MTWSGGTSRPPRAASRTTRSSGSRSGARRCSSAKAFPPVPDGGAVPKDVPRKPLELLVQGLPQSRVLATAVDMRLFTRLPAHGATVPEVASILGIPERSARILLTALTAMGLLAKRGPRYRNSPVAARYLVEGRPEFYGDFVRMMDRRLYDAYRHLEAALRTGRPVTSAQDHGDPFRAIAADPSMARLFTDAMHAAGTTWGR